jgi:hypothetical protein
VASRRRRAWWVAGWSVASGIVLWATLRFGALAWLSDKDHPTRPVVEAMSWVAGVAGFVVALVALMLARRQARDAADADAAPTKNRPGLARNLSVLVSNSRGVQVGIGQTQLNNDRRFFIGSKRNG